MKVTDDEMRTMAQMVSRNAYLADLVGSQVYDIAKNGKRRLSTQEIWNIDDLEEDDDVIPLDVIRFLKNKTKIPKFVDMIREEILIILKSEKYLETDRILRYSTFFNLKNLKEVEINNYNLSKLLLIICMEEEKIFYDVEEIEIEEIDRIYDQLYLNPENGDTRYVKAIGEYAEFI